MKIKFKNNLKSIWYGCRPDTGQSCRIEQTAWKICRRGEIIYGKTEKNDIFGRADKEAGRDGIKSKRKVWFRNDEAERFLCKKERIEEKRTAQSCWEQYKNIRRDHGIYLFWGWNKLDFRLFWWEKGNLSVTSSGSSRVGQDVESQGIYDIKISWLDKNKMILKKKCKIRIKNWLYHTIRL